MATLEDAVAGLTMHRNSTNPTPPLRIIIIGGGIGGLTAANFLRRAGHAVTVLEQWRGTSEAGAAIMLPPTANTLFQRFGFEPEKHGANEYRVMTEYAADGTLIASRDMGAPRAGEGNGKNGEEGKGAGQYAGKASYVIMHRANLHAALRESATRGYLPGMPASIRLSSRVVGVDPAAGIVTLDGGQQLQGDVIVGADGLSSVCRKRVKGGENIKPVPTGKSAYRFLMLRKIALENKQTQHFAAREGEFIGWWGDDRRIAMYPCSNDELLNFVCVVPDSNDVDMSEDEKMEWSNSASKDRMLEAYKPWNNSEVLQLLSLAEANTVRAWQIQDMEKLPTIVTGKLVLIGDAARPIQPYHSQGGAQAVEDAASLAIMLSFGTRPEEVSARLKLYEKCRYERGHYVQDFVRRTGLDRGAAGRPSPPEVGAFMKAILSHNEWEHSTKKLQEWLASRPTSPLRNEVKVKDV